MKSTKYRFFINGPYAGSYDEVIVVWEEWQLHPDDEDFDKEMQQCLQDWFNNAVEYGYHETEDVD